MLGQRLKSCTYHKTLHEKINTDILLRWILILEEYGPNIEYTQGGKNVVVDALSIFPRDYTIVQL